MPRAKVRPQDRRRAVKACQLCKLSKIRCDAGTPCANCRKRGKEAACSYVEGHPAQMTSNHDSPSELGEPTSLQPHRSQTSNISSESEGATQVSNDHHIDPDLEEGREDSLQPQSRLLLTSRQQKVFVGENASLSYLHLLRNIVRYQIGPCGFSEEISWIGMLEAPVDQSHDPVHLDHLDHNSARLYTSSFLTATCGLINLSSCSDLMSAIERPSTGPSDILSLSTLHLILAVGAQCHGSKVDAEGLFHNGRSSSFEGLICDPSPEMVQNFLLMAFYMLGACRRNAAYMYLGIASKAASALGLHRAEHYRGLTDRERNTRLRAWMSLGALDTIVNSILGRSTDAPITRLHATKLHDVSQSDPESVDAVYDDAIQATYDICLSLDTINRSGSDPSPEPSLQNLQKLRQWSRSLPQNLQQRSEHGPQTSSIKHTASLIGGTHVACAYYFTIILTTRQFLTSTLLAQIRQEKSKDNGVLDTIQRSDDVSELSFVCLDAAIQLADRCHFLVSADHLAANMCILKAWVFAAGLVIGFTRFVQQTVMTSETDQAFRNAIVVLERLAVQSPQARRYLEVLQMLDQAISLRHRQRLRNLRQMSSQYIENLFGPASRDIQDTTDADLAVTCGSSSSYTSIPAPHSRYSQAADYEIPDDLFFGCAALEDLPPLTPFFDYFSAFPG